MRNDGGYKDQKKKRKKKITIYTLTGLILIAVGVIGVLYVNSLLREKNYTAAIQSAQKYVAANDYEGAVREYTKAIESHPKQVDAYLELADVYLDQEQTKEARVILKKGYLKTGSSKIQYMLDGLSDGSMLHALGDGTDKRDLKDLDITSASSDIAWNMSFIQKIESFDFAAFKAEFGKAGSMTLNEEGYLEVSHDSFDGTFYYVNTSENKNIVDVSRKTPSESGMPAKITLQSIGLLFRNFDGVVSLEKLEMMTGGTILPKQEEDRTIVELKTDNLIIRIQSDENGNIISPDAWNEILLVNANKDIDKPNYSGIVMDAVTGDGVGAAELTVKPYDKKNDKTVIKTKTNGSFELNIKPGRYELTISAKDYTRESFEIEIIKDRIYKGEQFIISPKLTKGTARIVLEWGAQPLDLDSYLDGTTESGDSVFISFYEKQAERAGEKIADLDVDCMIGYGPETVTIYDLNGDYRFWVEDFHETHTMKSSGAVVKVYLSGKQPVTIAIDPDGNVEDVWNVCEIHNGELKILNTAPVTGSFTHN